MTDGVQTSQMDVDLHTTDNAATQDVALPTVQVFDQLPDAYKKLGIASVAVVDTTGGVYTVGAKNLRVHGSIGGVQLSRYLDCGGSPMNDPANTYDLTLSATSYVTPNGPGSTLHTLVVGYAQDPASNAPPTRCVSKGAFEKRVAELVAGS